MMKILIVVFAGLVATVTSQPFMAQSSTTYNNMKAQHAIDGNMRSYALTGFESYPWIVVGMRNLTTAKRVLLTGSIPGYFEVRFGNKLNTVGQPGGFQTNRLCTQNPMNNLHSPDAPFVISCIAPLLGRYLSIEVVSATTGSVQMQLFEVAIE